MKIHQTAIVDSGAELDSSVTVGAYSIIEKGVRIGAGTEIGHHSLISGPTTIGRDNVIGPFTSIGTPPQDLKYKDEETELIIGDGNHIREYVSIHRGTPGARALTSIGNRCLLMAYVHVAHDCELGDQVIMANAATLGGHVLVEDKVTIGGLTAVHQFCRIGAHSYIGGVSGITKDVPPYVIVAGVRHDMRVAGINKIGLKRSGFDTETIGKLHKAYMVVFRSSDLLLSQALEKALAENPGCPEVERMISFIKSSKRGIVRFSKDDE